MSPRERWGLALAVALALAVRLTHLATVEPIPVVSDASGYDAAARRLVATGTLAFPVGLDLWRDDVFREDAWATYLSRPSNAWTMPAYPIFVAGIYRLAGTGPERLRPVRQVQAFLGAMTVALGFWIARRTLGSDVAWVALGLNALYPPNVWTPEYLMTEALFSAAFLAQVAVMLRAAGRGALSDYALLGIATAAAAWIRPVGAVTPAILLVLEGHRALRSSSPRPALGRVAARFAVLGAVFALLFAPWVARNARVYRTFMPSTSAAAFPAIQGELRLRGFPTPVATAAQYARIDLTGFDDHVYATRTYSLIRRHLPPAAPGDPWKLQLARARTLGEAVTTPFSFSGPPVPPGSRPFVLQVSLLALASIGLLRIRRDRSTLVFFTGVLAMDVLPYWLVSNLWSRYLYPIMPLVLVLAAGGIVEIARWIRVSFSPKFSS